MLITLTAKKQPDGSVELRNADQSLKARIPWWHSAKPDYRHRYITINCYRWRLIWDK